MSERLRLAWASVLACSCVSACVGPRLLGEVEGTQTVLQRAIRDGSKAAQCAPRETAIAEANIRFARDALAMGEYYRGKEHADEAALQTRRAREKTNACLLGDSDGDGYDDKTDRCPKDPEDFDAFEDEDGCPDRDNDGDNVPDAATLQDGAWISLDAKDGRDCRNEKEDFDGFEDQDGCPDPDNDGDGVLDDADRCRDDPEDLDNFDDADGCPDPDNDNDKLCDPWVAASPTAEAVRAVCSGTDKCPDEAEDFDGDRDDDGCPDRKAAFDGCSVKITEKVFFKFDKTDIDPRSYPLLDDVASVIGETPAELHFRIEGHTDAKGSERYNKVLSQKRADAVRAYLVGKGVGADRLEGTGLGEGSPIDSNRTADGRARNRRVEFNVSNAECKRSP